MSAYRSEASSSLGVSMLAYGLAPSSEEHGGDGWGQAERR
jgi:hypothetical protein